MSYADDWQTAWLYVLNIKTVSHGWEFNGLFILSADNACIYNYSTINCNSWWLILPSYSHDIQQHTCIIIFLWYILMCLYRKEFFEKIWITQLIRSCLTSYRILRFIVFVSRARNPNTTRARSFHSTSSYSLEYYFSIYVYFPLWPHL